MAIERKHLTGLQSAKLFNLIEAEYISSGKDDESFRTYAVEKLGFPMTRCHVTDRRQELGVKSPRDRQGHAGSMLELADRLESVEKQLSADQKEFRRLAAVFLELKSKVEMLEKACRLKGVFEVPIK